MLCMHRLNLAPFCFVLNRIMLTRLGALTVTAAFFIPASTLFAASNAPGFKACPQFFPGAMPKVPNAGQLFARELCFDAFAVLHSGLRKTPIYTVEKLTAEQLQDAKDEVRTNRFFVDSRLPSVERATLDDYKGSGFDRGHMAPAGDMPTAQAMAQSFSLANMIPQAPENNRGVWAKAVEKATRQYVMRAGGPVYVFTGPYFGQEPQKIGVSHVWVPTYIYKLVYDPQVNRAWAYWIENRDDARGSKPISYEELVRRTGIELLPGAHPKS